MTMRPMLFVAVLFAACATAPRGPVPIAPQPMPLVMDQLAGPGRVDLTAFKGQVVLLDLWASWCPPCKEELPLLDAMARRLAGDGVVIVAVSVDEDKAAARAFAGRHGEWTLTLAHDPQGTIPERLQPPKMPSAYLIDRAGTLRYINAGYEPGDAPLIEARLRELARR
jgi:thiol-disulfide isomerase/thioredoxin